MDPEEKPAPHAIARINRGALLHLIAVFFIIIFAAITHAEVLPTPTPVASPIHENPVPVSFNLPIALTALWITSVAAGLTGVAVIWRYALKLAGLVTLLKELLPVIFAIAKEFKSDSGSTLKDCINRIEKAVEELKASNVESKTAAGLAKVMAEDLRHIVLEKK